MAMTIPFQSMGMLIIVAVDLGTQFHSEDLIIVRKFYEAQGIVVKDDFLAAPVTMPTTSLAMYRPCLRLKNGIYIIWKDSGEIICDGNLPNEFW
jgi:hypothetical protein